MQLLVEESMDYMPPSDLNPSTISHIIHVEIVPCSHIKRKHQLWRCMLITYDYNTWLWHTIITIINLQWLTQPNLAVSSFSVWRYRCTFFDLKKIIVQNMVHFPKTAHPSHGHRVYLRWSLGTPAYSSPVACPDVFYDCSVLFHAVLSAFSTQTSCH